MDLYGAGLIDGEGYIGIRLNKSKGHVSASAEVSIAMTDRGLGAVERMAKKYGGNVTPHKKADLKNRESFRWQVTGAKAVAVLREVRNELIVKRGQADIALKLHEMIENAPKRANGNAAWTDEMRATAQLYAAQVKDMNRPGPDIDLPDEKPMARIVAGTWWENEESLFGPVEFKERIPKSGEMISGRVYERPTSVPRTTVPASSLSPHLPTPAASDFKRTEESPADSQRRSPGITAVSAHFPEVQKYLPTPNVSDGTGGEQHPDKRVGHSRQLIDYALTVGDAKCLPTPKASDGVMGRPRTSGRPIEKSTHLGTIVTLLPDGATQPSMMDADDYGPELAEPESPFGVYAPAVHRWERVTGQEAPPPTELNTKGKPRLNAAFAEWMMGLPPGWVTDPAIGLTRAQQLKATGNGVCPQQANAALTQLLKQSN